jgi:hypothetical protein
MSLSTLRKELIKNIKAREETDRAENRRVRAQQAKLRKAKTLKDIAKVMVDESWDFESFEMVMAKHGVGHELSQLGWDT